METITIKGPLTEEKIKMISEIKEEPDWMLNIRIKAFRAFKELPLPNFGPDLSKINFDNITYYSSLKSPIIRSFDQLPSFIKDVIVKLGLEKEFEYLSSLFIQWDSSVILKEVKKYLEEEGVIFTSLDEAVKEYPEILKKYFSKIVPINDNKFAALNTAVWSGGVFIYIPENKKIDLPLHAYFLINLENMGQFERTLIIVEKNAKGFYIEGCTVPTYALEPLHAAVVEVFVKENSEFTYSTIQNWSKNVYNLVTKRAKVEKNAKVKWISAEFGSKITMLYPGLILEENSFGEIYTFSLPVDGQILDTGGRIISIGENNKGIIVTKSIAIGKNKETISINRVDIKILEKSRNSYIVSKCDSLIEGNGKIISIPRIEVFNNNNYYNHEAKMEKIDEEKLLYLSSLGIDKKDSKKLIYFGFIDDIIEKFPPLYQLEIKRLFDLELEKLGGFG